MSGIICKHCQAAAHVKNGIVRGMQRYRCEACGRNFTMTPPKGKPPQMKALALMLYAMGDMSFRGIARILGISDVTVLNWVRATAQRLPEPSVAAGTVIVTLDEMWHFLEKKLKNSGFGGRMTLSLAELSPGCVVAVMTRPAGGSSTRSGSRARPSSLTIGRGSTGSSPGTSSSRARI